MPRGDDPLPAPAPAAAVGAAPGEKYSQAPAPSAAASEHRDESPTHGWRSGTGEDVTLTPDPLHALELGDGVDVRDRAAELAQPRAREIVERQRDVVAVREPDVEPHLLGVGVPL